MFKNRIAKTETVELDSLSQKARIKPKTEIELKTRSNFSKIRPVK